MATSIPDNFETVTPSEADTRLAQESSRKLAARKLGKRSSVRLRVEEGDQGEAITVPASAMRFVPGAGARPVHSVGASRIGTGTVDLRNP